MQGDRSGADGSERIEEIGHGDSLSDLPRLPINHLSKRSLQEELVVCDRTEAEFVGQKGMHAIDGNELFCEGVGYVVEILWGAGDTTDDLALTDAPEVPI